MYRTGPELFFRRLQRVLRTMHPAAIMCNLPEPLQQVSVFLVLLPSLHFTKRLVLCLYRPLFCQHLPASHGTLQPDCYLSSVPKRQYVYGQIQLFSLLLQQHLVHQQRPVHSQHVQYCFWPLRAFAEMQRFPEQQ